MDKNSKNSVKKVSFGSTSVIYIPIEERSGACYVLDRARFERRITALEKMMKDLLHCHSVYAE